MSIGYSHEMIDELRRCPANRLPVVMVDVRRALVAAGRSESAARALVAFAVKQRDRDRAMGAAS